MFVAALVPVCMMPQTDKCWNTTEVILVRTADSIGAGLSGVGTTGTRRHGDSSFGADVVAGEDGDQ